MDRVRGADEGQQGDGARRASLTLHPSHTRTNVSWASPHILTEQHRPHSEPSGAVMLDLPTFSTVLISRTRRLRGRSLTAEILHAGLLLLSSSRLRSARSSARNIPIPSPGRRIRVCPRRALHSSRVLTEMRGSQLFSPPLALSPPPLPPSPPSATCSSRHVVSSSSSTCRSKLTSCCHARHSKRLT